MENGDKIFYQKKIIYLDYMERDNKIKNGGFIKWEARGRESRIQIHIRGLYPTDSLDGELQLLSWGVPYTADRIRLSYGTGEYAGIWHNDDLAGTGISYEDCDGIVIKLSHTRLLKGIWRNRKAKREIEEPAETTKPEEPADTIEIAEIPEATKPEEPAEAMKAVEIPEATKPEEPAETMKSEELAEAMEIAEIPDTTKPEEPAEAMEAIEIPEATKPEELAETMGTAAATETAKPKQMQILPNKWEQLNRIYPKIQPFGDVREYLSIAPCDFIILSEHYQELVQNSFLLHGYYNYGHLILTKIREGLEENYYLGVPGVYFEREKQAALLFGFEGFEGDGEAVTDGSFGYYMKHVEI